MNIEDTRKCNLMNLRAVARYMGIPAQDLTGFYDELLADDLFLAGINQQIATVRAKWGFRKGIFAKDHISSIDWFAFERVLIYVLIRLKRPAWVLETGVYYGGNSAFALRALERNRHGRMVSVDYPDAQIRGDSSASARHVMVGETELYEGGLKPGFMVADSLWKFWELVEGDSLKVIPQRAEIFDFYIHDSDHSMGFLTKELEAVWSKLAKDAILLVDDIDWSNAFYSFCVQKRLWPLLLTDNGKDDLRVRTGIVKLNHTNNQIDSFT